MPLFFDDIGNSLETLYHQKYNLCENAAAHGEEFSLIRLLRSHSILAKRVPLAFGNVRKGACAVAQTFPMIYIRIFLVCQILG